MTLESLTSAITAILPTIVYGGLLLWMWRIYQQWRASSARPPLPPGPPPKLVIGNLTDMPTTRMWETFAVWAEKYGDVVYANVFGQHIVYLSSFDAAWDLLEKRSAIYSDRVRYTMLSELVGIDWNLVFMQYGDYWRLHRKMFHQKINSTTASKTHDVVLKHERAALVKLQSDPEHYLDHIKHMMASIIFDTIYGLDILPQNDPLVKMSEESFTAIVAAATPGAFLVDILPILKYLPSWFPGARFKRQAAKWKDTVSKVLEAPFLAAKRNYENEQPRASFATMWFEKLASESDLEQKRFMEKAVRNVCGVAYGAGFETTVSAIHDFFLAMMLCPHVQQKAHEELDSVVGPHRLPEFSDRPNLPYINAIYKEIIRWRPVVPLGVPHRLIRDDIYRGMFLPKGSQIVVNQWAILHNEDDFGPNSMEFNPERFLRPGIKDPIAAFGFGRRICPGRYMAEDTIFMTIASILHTFKISPAKDDLGNDIPVAGTMTCGLTVQPEEFSCAIKPRSSASFELLRSLRE